MIGPTIRPRRVAALLITLGLAATLTGCGSGGAAKSSGATTSTRRRAHRPTTTSRRRSTATVSSTTTTPSGGQPDPAVTDPPAVSTTTTPAGGAPCGPQEAHLTAVVTGGDLSAVPVDRYTVTNCRLASSSLIWGAMTLAPKPDESVPPMTVVFERIGSIWTVHSYASGATGCDAPAPVPAQLALGC